MDFILITSASGASPLYGQSSFSAGRPSHLSTDAPTPSQVNKDHTLTRDAYTPVTPTLIVDTMEPPPQKVDNARAPDTEGAAARSTEVAPSAPSTEGQEIGVASKIAKTITTHDNRKEVDIVDKWMSGMKN